MAQRRPPSPSGATRRPTHLAGPAPLHILLLLRADEVVPPDRRLTAGTAITWRHAKVDTRALAVTLVGAAILDLEDRGHVALSMDARSRRLLRRRRVVVVERVRDARHLGGLRGLLMDAVRAGGSIAADLVTVTVGGSERSSHEFVVEMAIDEAATLGYLADPRAVFRGRDAGSRPPVTPDLAAIARTDGDAVAAVDRWHRFARQRPALATLMASQIARALKEISAGME